MRLGYNNFYAGFPHDHHYAYEHHVSQNLGTPYHHVGIVQPYIAQPGKDFNSYNFQSISPD